jgi:regulatory protein
LTDALRARALRLLARREHSRAELRAKLEPDAEGDPRRLDALLDELERRGWLSEARLVESLLHARRGRFGAARIAQELRRKGASEEAIGRASAEAARTELQAAREVWRRKFGHPPANLAERARQTRFLASRGFAAEVIRRVLDQRED